MLPAFAETTAEKVFEKLEIASSSISFSTVKTKQYQKVTNLLRFKIKGVAWKHQGRIPETNTQVHKAMTGTGSVYELLPMEVVMFSFNHRCIIIR